MGLLDPLPAGADVGRDPAGLDRGVLGFRAAQVDKLQIHAVDGGGEYLNDLGPGIWLCFGAAFAALASGLAIFETRRRTDADTPVD